MRLLAERDVLAFERLLQSKGGDLGDEIISRAEAKERLLAFVRELYAQVGRVDFWPLQSAYNMGTGFVVFSFHGKIGMLVNGPTWGVDGIHIEPGQRTQLDEVLGNSPVTNINIIRFTTLSNNGAPFFTAGVNTHGRQFTIGASADTRIWCYAHISTWGSTPFAYATYDTGAAVSEWTGMHFYAFRVPSNTDFRATVDGTHINPNSVTGNWDESSPSLTRFGATTYFGASSIIVPFQMVLNGVSLTDVAVDGIRSAFKNTLGEELGLS